MVFQSFLHETRANLFAVEQIGEIQLVVIHQYRISAVDHLRYLVGYDIVGYRDAFYQLVYLLSYTVHVIVAVTFLTDCFHSIIYSRFDSHRIICVYA